MIHLAQPRQNQAKPIVTRPSPQTQEKPRCKIMGFCVQQAEVNQIKSLHFVLQRWTWTSSRWKKDLLYLRLQLIKTCKSKTMNSSPPLAYDVNVDGEVCGQCKIYNEYRRIKEFTTRPQIAAIFQSWSPIQWFWSGRSISSFTLWSSYSITSLSISIPLWWSLFELIATGSCSSVHSETLINASVDRSFCVIDKISSSKHSSSFSSSDYSSRESKRAGTNTGSDEENCQDFRISKRPSNRKSFPSFSLSRGVCSWPDSGSLSLS